MGKLGVACGAYAEEAIAAVAGSKQGQQQRLVRVTLFGELGVGLVGSCGNEC